MLQYTILEASPALVILWWIQIDTLVSCFALLFWTQAAYTRTWQGFSNKKTFTWAGV